MKCPLVFGVLFLHLALCWGQPPDRNDLFEKLNASQNDSTKAVLLNTIARTYARENKDSAIYYFNLATRKSQEIDEKELEVNSLNFIGMTYAIWGDFDSAEKSLLEALKACEAYQLDSVKHQTYFGLANVVESKGDLNKALKYYLVALKYFEKTQAHKSINRTKANISYIYMKTGDLEKAYSFIKESNRYYRESGADRQLMNGYSRLGAWFSQMNKPDSAILYHNNALLLAENLKDDLSKYEIKINLANTLYQSRKFDQAAGYYKDIISYSEKSGGNPGSMLNACSSISVCYLMMNEPRNATIYIKKGLEILPSVSEQKNIIDYYHKMFLVDSLTGDYRNAIINYQKHINLKDSLFNIEKHEQLAELETEYETEKITNQRNLAEERALLAETKSRQNLILFIGSLIVVLLIIISAIFYFSKLKQAKKAEMVALQLRESQRRLALEKQYRDSELKALKAQMNPHFIFNVLNSIQEFIILNQKDLASDYLAMFADLIRGYLHYSSLGHIPLADEIESISQYLELEKLRFGESMSFEVDFDSKLNTEAIKIPTMIIQPYVENAIKHGLFSKKGDKKLSVDFRSSDEETIICTITDNGVGRAKASELKQHSPAKYKSFATEANASRLELFNQTTYKKIGVETEDLTDENGPSGTRVIITIPSIKK
ncbi:MAG: histidine kinase [Cyclobacteriaceae bacterium]